MPIEVSRWALSWNLPSTWSILSRVMPLSLAMAWPIFCTSLGARYLNTCAASSSPSDIRRIALLVSPASLIAIHPALDDVRDDLGVLARQRPRALQLIDAERLQDARRFGRGQRQRRQLRHACRRLAQHRPHHAEEQVRDQRREQHVLADLLGERDVLGLLPHRQLRDRLGDRLVE